MCLLTLKDVKFFQKVGFFANLIIFGTCLASFGVFLATANIQGGLVHDLMVYCSVCFGFGTLGLLAEVYIILIRCCGK